MQQKFSKRKIKRKGEDAMTEKEYFLGLDMGTGSLGWAVTDQEYQLLRAHGKDLWGIRLFEAANTAEERRQFR